MNESQKTDTNKPERISSPELDSLDLAISEQKEVQKILLEDAMPLEIVYKWEAPERVFQKRDRNWYVVVAALAMGAIVLSALTNNFVLIFAIIALVLVLYTLNTIPPRIITHEITNKGVHSFEVLYTWKNIQSFWVLRRGKEFLFNFEVKNTNDTIYRRMIILVGNGDLKKITTYVVRHVDYLAPNEISINPLSKYIEGEYIPLLRIVNEKDLQTKDPKDAAAKPEAPGPISFK